jgi:D-ribulokinase
MATAIGIDFGTSGARSIAIDTDRNILHRQSVAYLAPNSAPNSAIGWRDTLWQLLASIPKSVKKCVSRIAIDGTSGTVMLGDGRGELIGPPLMYDDNRGRSSLDTLDRFVPAGHITRSASSSLAKLIWFSQQPDFDRARYFFHQADWLAALLHGKYGISDYHNALKLGFDVENLCYPAWLDRQPYRGILPQVLTPGEAIGEILPAVARELDLPPDCQVVAGTTDSIAAFIASGASRAGEGVTSLGSTLVLKLLSNRRIEDLAAGIYSHRWGDLWLVGGASNTGGGVLRHYFSDSELVSLSDRIEIDRPCQLDYYPLLSDGDRFPINDPHLPPRLTPRPADDAEFLYGLLTGMAKIEATGYRLLGELGASKLTSIFTAGGGANNPTWTNIRHQYLQVPMLAPVRVDAAYGTALLAISAK